MNKDDIPYFYEQIEDVLNDDKFTPFLNALKISGKNLVFDKKADVSSIIDNIEMNEYENAFVNLLTTAILNKKTLKIEFFTSDPISAEGQNIIYNNCPADELTAYPNGVVSGATATYIHGGALTAKNGGDSYSLINTNYEKSFVTENTFHEILGHGLSIVLKKSYEENNSYGIRVTNLIRRFQGKDLWNGAGHSTPYNNPYDIPIIK